MANTLRIKRRAAGGAAGAPASLANAELAFNEQDNTLYYGTGTGGAGGTATSVIAIGGPGAFVGLSGDQTVAGIKTFSSTIVGSISGNAGTATALATARSIGLSGDVTGTASFNGTANATITATLANSGVTAGSYGSATQVGQVTVDAKGRVTAASNIAITFPVTSVAGRTGAITPVARLASDLDEPGSASHLRVATKYPSTTRRWFAAQGIQALLAEQQLRPLLPPSVMQSMNGFFEQARANLAPHQNATLEKQWLQKVRVVSETQPLLPPQIAEGVLEQTSQALYNNQWLELDYTNAKEERKQHRVMPLGLAQQGPRIYLVCRFDGYNNERSMALHRVHSAKASTLTFERPDFDLARYDADGRFAIANGERIRLSFVIDKAPGKHLLESRLSEDQTHTETDTNYRITATVVQTLLLDRWLLSFGGQIRDVQKTPVGA